MRILKRIKTVFVDYFGVGYRGVDRPDSISEVIAYSQTQGLEVLQEHRDYLLRLEDSEGKRLDGIEAKTTQLIAQSGIVFSLLSIFIPILVERAADIFIAYRMTIYILLLTSICFYILSIINAAKNYLVNRYQYVAPAPETVLQMQANTQIAFIDEQIRDLVKTIKVGKHQNNRKASNLIHSSRAFQAANISSAVLVLVFALVLFDKKQPEVNTTIVKNPIKIEQMDSVIRLLVQHQSNTKAEKKLDTTKSTIIHKPDTALRASKKKTVKTNRRVIK